VRRDLYVGVMSGTSLDGIDAIVADFAGDQCTLLGAVSRPFAPVLRRELLALQAPVEDELARAARAAIGLADGYAEAINALLDETRIDKKDVLAAGVHGQTLRHAPHEAWTLQLNNPARVAERTGITVVADFRSRDLAAGGQGAPLVPAFHAALFAKPDRHRVIVNIGGIANVTSLPATGGAVRGFDTGPGNVLMDVWCERHRNEPFDRDGAWARQGAVNAPLLSILSNEAFFSTPPPKSTGRDLFNFEWLSSKLAQFAAGGAQTTAVDVQATLLALTAQSIAAAIERYCSEANEILICGGGAKNATLMHALANAMSSRRVVTTAEYGVAVEHVEALAFAWLAREAMAQRPGNLPAVTGASGPRVLGAIYPR
jgi:anhydro-N-acetylmuramic acid kinase